jgi:hypothetical protein
MAARSRIQALRDAWVGCGVFDSIHIHGYASALPPGCDQIACQESFAVGPCHLDPLDQLRQRRIYWQDREASLNAPAGVKKRTRRRNATNSESSPLVWTRTVGSQRKYGGANSLAAALAQCPRSKPVI